MRTDRWPIAGLIAAALMAFVAHQWLAPSDLGEVPDTKLSIIDGRTLRLQDMRGRPVLLTFWATTCPGCIREIPHLVGLYEELGPKGLEIIGVAMHYDPPNRVLALVRQRQIPYPIALDISAQAAAAFGDVQATPTNFLIAPTGRIVRRVVGELTETELAEMREQIVNMLKKVNA